MRLIDADALKEMICNNVYPITDTFNSQDYGMFWTGGIEKAIDEAPTIDAEPIRHGHWISERLCSTNGGAYGVRRCSNCEYYCNDYGDEWNYCPNCGASMDKEVEEDE